MRQAPRPNNRTKKTTDHTENTDKKADFFLCHVSFPLPPVRTVSGVCGSPDFFYFFSLFCPAF
jgi:hypothetical protein